MPELKIRTTTGADGAIHLDAAALGPNVEVEVVVRPASAPGLVAEDPDAVPDDIPASDYARLLMARAKPMRLPRIDPPLDLPGDPVQIQREMRDEWPD